jgi:putative ABC transport system permease protein
MAGVKDVLRQLLRDMRAQKLRTFLTVFGIVWGTVAVTLLLAFGTGLKKQQIKRFKGLGERIVIGWPGLTSIPFNGLGKDRRIQISEEDIALVAAQAQLITGISGEYAKEMNARYGKKNFSVRVSGVDPFFGKVRNEIPQAEGRFIDPIDMKEQGRVAFLGDKLADDTFGKVSSGVGQTVFLDGTPFLVVGVLQHKIQNSSYSGRDTNKIFIPSTTFHVLAGKKYYNDFIFQAKPGVDSKDATAEVRAILGRKLQFDRKDKEAISIWDTTEGFRFFDAFFLAFNLFLGGVGALTLVVGGIGVSNIMNVVIDERTKEIGVKMALGAREGYILRQFLLETVLLTAAGGLIGFLISYGICAAIPEQGLGESIGRPDLSPLVAGVTIAILGLVAFLAGYFPAREASRLDPVVAMKL